ncbi:unnamed protein product, partial [Prorocentrum cordatum]
MVAGLRNHMPQVIAAAVMIAVIAALLFGRVLQLPMKRSIPNGHPTHFLRRGAEPILFIIATHGNAEATTRTRAGQELSASRRSKPEVGVRPPMLELLRPSKQVQQRQVLPATQQGSDQHLQYLPSSHMMPFCAMANIQHGIATAVQTHLAPTVAMISTVEADMRGAQGRTSALEAEQENLRHEVHRMQQSLAMAESAASSEGIYVARLATWDRETNLRLVSIITETEVTKKDLLEGSAEWLDHAKVKREHIEIIGPSAPGKRFAVNCPGGEAGTTRAQALVRAQRDPTGKWRKFSATGVDGYGTNIYIGPDRNPKQMHRVVQTNKLQQLLQRALPNAEWWSERQLVWVHCGDLPLVEVIPGAAPNDPSKLAWSPAANAQYNVDKEQISRAFHQLFREVDTSTWRMKLARAVEQLKRGATVCLQEVHGTHETLKNRLRQYPIEVIIYTTMGDTPGMGGAAILVPRHSENTLSKMPQHSWPQIASRRLAKARALSVAISNPVSGVEARAINVHNHELKSEERAALKSAWQDNANWAREDGAYRIAVAIGGFNVSDNPNDALLFPEPRQ